MLPEVGHLRPTGGSGCRWSPPVPADQPPAARQSLLAGLIKIDYHRLMVMKCSLELEVRQVVVPVNISKALFHGAVLTSPVSKDWRAAGG